MINAEMQTALNEFEALMLDASGSATARVPLRKLLFSFAQEPLEGSLADAVRKLAEQPRPQGTAAAVLLRAIAEEDLLPENATNNLARNVVTLVSRALPGLSDFLKLQERSQTYEKFELLRGAKAWVDGQLEPLRVSYTTLEAMLSARKRVIASLAHGRLLDLGIVYHLPEVKEAVEAVFSSLDQVAKITARLASDVETCERAIADAQHLVTYYPSFVTILYLKPWLQSASTRLKEFTASLRGRFTAAIVRDWTNGDLPKRYPLRESGRDLRILVPFRSDGRGAATDVRIKVLSDSQQILFMNEEISLGSVSPGRFSAALDVHVVDACPHVSLMLEVEWGEVGTSERRNALFELRVLAQSAGIDWDAYTYADPYGTGPAEGDEFVGRKEQVQTLVARMLRRPMEPSYITGQKRVGKTSLATAAAAHAYSRDPKGKLSWHYILWGQIAHEDPRTSLRQLGEQIEKFVRGEMPGTAPLPRGTYEGSLSPLMKLFAAAKTFDAARRFILIIDEFDEMP